jgi:hypothetical protein
MNIQFVRPAAVRGWCKPKALLKILYHSPSIGIDQCIWLESGSPDNKREADEINAVMNEIVCKLQ